MLSMEEKAQVRHAVLVEGKSQRQVARETGHSRNTIRKMIQDSKRPKYQLTQARSAPVLGAYKTLLEEWVKEDAQKPKKQRRTTVRMYQLLKQDYGYSGAWDVCVAKRKCTLPWPMRLARQPRLTLGRRW